MSERSELMPVERAPATRSLRRSAMGSGGAAPEVMSEPFPFSAVVGQDDLKLALLLAAIDPLIGGVLARGEKGSGKTTLARGLAALLPGSAPFVELPLGATEDRVIGSIDFAATLASGSEVARRGLLAEADGGVVYVDEMNLLADHLVDALLDVAVSGIVRLDRDGVSVTHPARFVLLGTMNPEEGELRPQLLDRFGLCVDVSAPHDLDDRVAIVTRRLQFDGAGGAEVDPAVAEEDRALAARLAAAKPARLGDGVARFASALAMAVGAEGLRADIVLCRAAAALAGWDGRGEATTDDVERVAALVLAHRRRRNPFDPPGLPDDELADAIDRAGERVRPPVADGSECEPTGESSPSPVDLGAERAVALGRGAVPHPAVQGRRDSAFGSRGRLVRDVAFDNPAASGVAVAATVREIARRRVVEPGGDVRADDVRGAIRRDRVGSLVIIALDTSGSMGARERVDAATGVVLGLLTDAYQQRDRVAVVTFGGDGARVALAPTGSVEVARARLGDVATGGHTPLADGLRVSLDVANRASARGSGQRAIIVLITDGRATVAPGATEGDGAGIGAALAEARDAARGVAAASPHVAAVVFDAETGSPRLGLATELAAEMGAPCHRIDEFSPAAMRRMLT